MINSISTLNSKLKVNMNVNEDHQDDDDSQHLVITDIAMHFDDINEMDPLLTNTKHKNPFMRFFRSIDIYIALILIAIITASLSAVFTFG